MSRGRRGRGHEEEVENGERWLLTYADMITLLLALFIVLFAISTINQKKFLALALGLKQSFDPKPGVLPSSNGLLNNASLTQTAGSTMSPLYKGSVSSTTTIVPGQQSPDGSGSSSTQADLQAVRQKLQTTLTHEGLNSDVSFTMTAKGLVISILADKTFFATGSADLGPAGNQVVDTVASVLKSDSYDVDVDGYTDNQPLIGGLYGSNEVLSSVRADNVVLRLENTDAVNPNRLSATGYGDTHPLAANDTPQHMALNRRIDIVILSSSESQP
ncbi:MAG TPA: flagellar motor protein MotB [Acidimicrobiales bacterium]|jgi:chemotaxis protein MotB|nr:flagellar motor protein MotB [Acidimicrobiales bacterium]